MPRGGNRSSLVRADVAVSLRLPLWSLSSRLQRGRYTDQSPPIRTLAREQRDRLGGGSRGPHETSLDPQAREKHRPTPAKCCPYRAHMLQNWENRTRKN